MFSDPEDFDTTRERPHRHVAFGYGEHLCVGATLARLEARCVLDELCRFGDRLQLAGEPEIGGPVLGHGFLKLPLTLADATQGRLGTGLRERLFVCRMFEPPRPMFCGLRFGCGGITRLKPTGGTPLRRNGGAHRRLKSTIRVTAVNCQVSFVGGLLGMFQPSVNARGERYLPCTSVLTRLVLDGVCRAAPCSALVLAPPRSV